MASKADPINRATDPTQDLSQRNGKGGGKAGSNNKRRNQVGRR